jgi:hypothetical protein
MPRKTSERGSVLLLEMLIVVSILGVLLAMSASMANDTDRQHKVEPSMRRTYSRRNPSASARAPVMRPREMERRASQDYS